MRKLIIVAAAAAGILLAGCQTMEGLGQDLKKGADHVSTGVSDAPIHADRDRSRLRGLPPLGGRHGLGASPPFGRSLRRRAKSAGRIGSTPKRRSFFPALKRSLSFVASHEAPAALASTRNF